MPCRDLAWEETRREGGPPLREDLPERFRRDRTYDLDHVRLDLSLDEARREVSGTVTHILKPLHGALDRVELDAVDLEIRGVKVDGRKAGFDHHDGTLAIRLPRKGKAGVPIEVAVRYRGRPSKGLFFIGPDAHHPKKPRMVWSQGEMEDNRYWFPCCDAPDDKCTSEVILDVPSKYTALSNGRLVSETKGKKRGRKRVHWSQEIPHVPYLIAIAVGEFDVVRDAFDGIPVEYYAPKGRGKDLRPTFEDTPDMLAFFSEVTGVRYPYDRYLQVAVTDFFWGGMENTAMTVMTERAVHPRRLKREVFTNGLLAHELAHQWWGDLITMKSWEHIWLNEAFASYFDPLWHEHAKGADEFGWIMRRAADRYFAEAKKYVRPIADNRYRYPEDMFDAHSYRKGACVLHALRHELGDDLWWKGIRHYAQKHARGSVETHDFKLALEEATGRSLDRFFRQWILSPGHPELEVATRWDEEGGILRIDVKQIQTTGKGIPVFRFKLPVTLLLSKDTRDEVFEVERKQETFAVRLPERPEAVLVDPSETVLKKIKHKRTKSELLAALAGAPQGMGRVQAAEGMTDLPRDADLVEGLAEALRGDPFHGVRQAAAKGLGMIGGEEACDALLRAAGTEDPRVRRAVAEALGRFDPEEVEKDLARSASKDKSEFVRAAALEALGKSARRNGSVSALRILQAATRKESHNDMVRAGGLAGLGEWGGSPAIGPCRRFLRPGPETQTRCAAVRGMAALWKRNPDHRERILEDLLALEDDPEFYVRGALYGALGGIDDPRAKALLDRAADRESFYSLNGTAREAARRWDRARDAGQRDEEVRRGLGDLREEVGRLAARLAVLEGTSEMEHGTRRGTVRAKRTTGNGTRSRR